MTVSELKTYFISEISKDYSESEARELFSIFCEHILKLNKIELRNSGDKVLNINEQSEFYNKIFQLKLGKPYQLILGEAAFFGMKFFVNEHVLIPRPETEELLELAIKKLEVRSPKSEVASSSLLTDNQQPTTILDIGTGSGVIPIVLKKQFPGAEITSIDFSKKAIEVAKRNAAFHQTEINFVYADYLNTDLSDNFDVIISNPPYIGLNEETEIADSVKEFEPKMALFSPVPDPLIFYRKIAEDTRKHLKKNGMIFLEINQKLGKETLELFQNFPEAELLKDISGNDRMIFVRK